ncbi:HD-GYP domain-containing protein, partial [Angustibacter peucedani]
MPAPSTRWRARPVRAALLRAAAMVVPVVAGVASGVLISRVLPPVHSWPLAVGCWLLVLAASTVVMHAVDRVTRRLLPLATLLKLSMLFPDRAPSRYKVARSVSGTRALTAELERARVSGVQGDRQQAAETILALVGALGDYDSRTRGHSERTQLFVTMLADELKLKPDDRDRLVWAALVHDIGKLKVPSSVLNKPGAPGADEWELLRRHPVDGATICAPLREWLGPWATAIEQHHERFDGTGYPMGLSGEQIGFAGRVVAVADSYEVMTAARPYKKPMTPVQAREELARCAGTQFDPAVVRAFLNISLGRLRWVAGPLTWLAQVPLLQTLPSLGRALGTAAGAVATTATAIALGTVPWGHHDTRPPEPAAAVAVPAATPTATAPSPSATSTRTPRTPRPTDVPTRAAEAD